MPRFLAFASITLRKRLPSTKPGRTELTRIPAGPSSAESDFVNPITAHFDAQYGLRRAIPKRPAIEDRLTIEGFSLFRRCGTASRAQLNCPVMLIAIVL